LIASFRTSQKHLRCLHGFFFSFGCCSSSRIPSQNSMHMLEILLHQFMGKRAGREEGRKQARRAESHRVAGLQRPGAHAAAWGPCPSPATPCRGEEQRAQRASPSPAALGRLFEAETKITNVDTCHNLTLSFNRSSCVGQTVLLQNEKTDK